MTVTIDCRVLSQPVFRARGVGRYILELLNGILDRGELEQYRLLTAPGTGDAVLHRFPTISLDAVHASRKRRLWAQNIQLPLQLSRRRLGLVHFTLPEIAPRQIGSRYSSVVTVYDLMRYELPTTAGRRRLLEWSVSQVLRSATAVIAISEYTKAQLLDYLGSGAPPVHVIHLGVDSNVFFYRSRDEARQHVKTQLGVQEPFILYVGGFDKRKQVAHLVKVYHDLLQETQFPHSLVLAGRMEAYDSFIEVMRQVAHRKLHGRVIFTDYVSDEALANLYAAADVFAFPSAGEGFGIPVLEAMATGTPVVAFRNTAIPEVTDDAALLVNNSDWNSYAEALYAVIEDRELRTELSRKGLARAAEFSWKKMVTETLDLYRQFKSD